MLPATGNTATSPVAEGSQQVRCRGRTHVRRTRLTIVPRKGPLELLSHARAFTDDGLTRSVLTGSAPVTQTLGCRNIADSHSGHGCPKEPSRERRTFTGVRYRRPPCFSVSPPVCLCRRGPMRTAPMRVLPQRQESGTSAITRTPAAAPCTRLMARARRP